jgi:hypothetical protein
MLAVQIPWRSTLSHAVIKFAEVQPTAKLVAVVCFRHCHQEKPYQQDTPHRLDKLVLVALGRTHTAHGC